MLMCLGMMMWLSMWALPFLGCRLPKFGIGIWVISYVIVSMAGVFLHSEANRELGADRFRKLW